MLRLAYFADDFTGATDALESLSRAGVRTRLFLEPPSATQCAGLDAIGVAGLTRSLATDKMEEVLRPAFAALRALEPRHVHYKVCSTFDSSPGVGSIGRAIEIGAAVFGGRVVPLLVAAPALGRYCAFGNLFARYGIGSAGAIHRLDRHPAVSRHPVTPMTEADLTVHLAAQTRKKIGLLDVRALEAEPEAAFRRLAETGHEIVLIDGVNDAHLLRAGALLDSLAGQPLFSVGSSGVGAALCAHWTAQGRLTPPQPQRNAGPAEPLLVVSGSCSPVTVEQVEWARQNGFAGVSFHPGEANGAILGVVVSHLKKGRSVVVFTHANRRATPVSTELLGASLGVLACDAIAQTGVKRLVVAGGDTSSHAGRALGLESLEMLASLVPGAPLCRASARSVPAHGLQIVFKGGQVGAPDFFGAVARGTL